MGLSDRLRLRRLPHRSDGPADSEAQPGQSNSAGTSPAEVTTDSSAATPRVPLSARAYLYGWRALRALPASQAYFLAAAAADATWRRRGVGVRRLEANLAAVGVEPAAIPQMSKAALRSYLRYWCEVFRISTWSREQVLASVRVEGDAPVREALAEGKGVVFALAHQGNWDLAGAWSVYDLGPVTTVAERLEPAEVYQSFLEVRQQLGMTVHPLGEPGLVGELCRALKDGHIVALLADRDLTGSGAQADLCGHQARVASGPAVLADLTAAPLVPVTIIYEKVAVDADGWPESGYRTVITFHPRVDLGTGTRHERVRTGVEGVAAALGAGIAATPADWHMLQPVFAEDLYREADSRRSARSRHGAARRAAGDRAVPRRARLGRRR